MLNKSQKSEIVQGLVDRFRRQKIAIFSDFSGISVAKSQALRRALKKEDAEYKVTKKTLLGRALENAGISFNARALNGEIGVAFGYQDQAAPAKILAKFSRENETFKILGAILGARALTGKDVLALSRLPSREALLAQVVGALSGPMRGLAVALQGNIRNLAYVLNQVGDKKF